MKELNKLNGKCFERLLVIKRVENDKYGRIRYECLCSCGKTTTTLKQSLLSGNTKSCGCLQKESLIKGYNINKNKASKNNHKCPNCNQYCSIKPSRLLKSKIVCCSMKCKIEYFNMYPEHKGNFKKRTPIETFFAKKFTRWKSSASKRNIYFDVSLQSIDLVMLWQKQKGRCYYTNIPMSTNKKDVLTLVSVDRKNSDLGYTLDNIVLCCYSVNSFKFSFSSVDIQYFIKLIYDNYENKF